ncbi:MAG: hypothetical protein ACYTGS_10405 [Planctomycetota bacterium]
MFGMTRVKCVILQLMLVNILMPFVCCAKGNDFTYFNTEDIGKPDGNVPLIQPWKIIGLNAEYGGQWVVAGDVDADGEVEIVSAENFNDGDVHYTSTAVAQNLDGSVLWRWGESDVGRKSWHHDVACQIHDWNGDGRKEVVLCTKGFLVEIDGATGRELRRIHIAADATDCLVFCNLSGGKNPTDVLVKDRYRRIWAYNQQGKLLWTVEEPGGFKTAHQPRPIDIDGDGRDEIIAGYALLNYDGSVRWVFESGKVDHSKGHLDCARVLRKGASPEDFRIVLTCCGANNVALVDGNGRVLWEVSGHHFESVDVGHVIPNHAGRHIVVDIDHHDGIDEILVAHKGGIYNSRGVRIGTFSTPGLDSVAGKRKYEKSMLIGDMTGDGIPDVVIATPDTVYIYKNENGRKTDRPVPPGTEFNFTLY